MIKLTRFLQIAAVAALLGGCEDNRPMFKIVGGGFMFNYRYAKATYGFVVRPQKPLPAGSILEASFDLPDSDQKYVVREPSFPGKLQYGFETEALHGIKKKTPYTVKLRLLEAGTERELAAITQVYMSDIDQEGLPTKAPVQGIGYAPAPP
jgi:hypothetical protein